MLLPVSVSIKEGDYRVLRMNDCDDHDSNNSSKEKGEYVKSNDRCSRHAGSWPVSGTDVIHGGRYR